MKETGISYLSNMHAIAIAATESFLMQNIGYIHAYNYMIQHDLECMCILYKYVFVLF